ncbi:hypothetical protein NDU88_000258, partial [Pleurodeles waltl]
DEPIEDSAFNARASWYQEVIDGTMHHREIYKNERSRWYHVPLRDLQEREKMTYHAPLRDLEEQDKWGPRLGRVAPPLVPYARPGLLMTPRPRYSQPGIMERPLALGST